MADLFDYIKWRGDIPFSVSSFCALDALILCQISYVCFDGVVPRKEERSTILADSAVDKFFSIPDVEKRSYNGVLISPRIIELFRTALKSGRFRDVRLFAYENVTETESVKQFCAVSFLIPDKSKTVFCAFRGTDDTIVGWKEDFMMAFMPVVPAQQAAVEYVDFISSCRTVRCRRMITGGHSKGGNLAVYAAAFCRDKTRRKILSAYNFDGPGFSRETLESLQFKEIAGRIFSYTPEVSVVGMLFEHTGKFEIVASSEKGLSQHDAFSWKLDGPEFLLLQDTSSSSKFFDRTMKKFLEDMNADKRRSFVDSLFNIIEASNARTLTDLKNGGFETSRAILSAIIKKTVSGSKKKQKEPEKK